MTAVNALSSMMSLVHLYMFERLAYFLTGTRLYRLVPESCTLVQIIITL